MLCELYNTSSLLFNGGGIKFLKFNKNINLTLCTFTYVFAYNNGGVLFLSEENINISLYKC
jgi:hypothetical protein